MKNITRSLAMGSLPFVVFFLSMSTFAQNALAVEKASKITFDESNHDFGKVQQGVELTFVYAFTNDGDQRLVIQNVRASCGCTGASIGDKKEFDKGERGEIKVSFNTGGRSGVQSKTVTVRSNDPKNPTVVLSFTCNIVANDQSTEEHK